MQLWLGLAGLFVFFIVLFIFPETYHPGKRGIENVDPASLPKWRPVLINPLKPLWIMRSPNLLAVVRYLLFMTLTYPCFADRR